MMLEEKLWNCCAVDKDEMAEGKDVDVDKNEQAVERASNADLDDAKTRTLLRRLPPGQKAR